MLKVKGTTCHMYMSMERAAQCLYEEHYSPTSVYVKPPDHLLVYIVPLYFHKAHVRSSLHPVVIDE